MIYQYFIDGFWQTCKMIDFHHFTYTIEFKGSLFIVPSKQIRFVKNNQLLFTPLKKIVKNCDIVYQ